MKIFNFLFVLFFLVPLYSYSQTDNPEYKDAVNYFKQANEFKQKFDFANAEINFTKAADLFKKNKYAGNYIQCKYSVSDIYIQQNKFKEAEEILSEIEMLAKQKYGEENMFLRNIYFGKGMIAAASGKADTAIVLYGKAVEINEKSGKPDAFLQSNIYGSMGNAYSDKGDYNNALKYYRNDLEIKKQLVGEAHPVIAVAYNNIANVYQAAGDLEKALEYVDKALSISIAANGKNNPETANYYATKGAVYADKDEYDLALEYFNKALSINKAIYGAKHKSIADMLIRKGIVYNKKNDSNKALIAFKDAYDIQLSVFGENHPDLAGSCNNIGYILEQQGKKESALKFYEKAIEIKKAYFGEDHPELASYYNNIGNNYEKRQDYDNALIYLLKAGEILEKKYGNKNTSLVNIYANIGSIYVKKSDFQNALMYYQKSIAANVRDFNPAANDYYLNPVLKNYTNVNKLLISLDGKASAFVRLYQKDSLYNYLKVAHENYVLCDSIIVEARKTLIKKEDKINLGNNARNIYEQAVVTAIGLSDASTDNNAKKKYLEQAFIFAEKNKAAVLSDALTASEAKFFSGIPDSIQQKEKFLKNAIAAVEKSIAISVDNDDINRLNQKLFDLNTELRAFNRQIEHDFPKYYQSKYSSKTVRLQDIQGNLDDESVVRSYFIGADNIFIFTIAKNDMFVSFAEKPENLYEKIVEFNTHITSGYASSFSKYLQIANELYTLLFPNKISDKIKNISIIPDGMLYLIPYEALITEQYSGDIKDFKSYPFLIKRFNISYDFSAGLSDKLANTNKPAVYTADWLGVAPVFGDGENMLVAGHSVTPLPGSEKEINAIDTIFKQQNLSTLQILRTEANEHTIKQTDLEKYKYIHIATHGIVNMEEPKLSGLIFNPSDKTEDGVLYSGEIYNLELNADLVVLSACETGMGKVSKSEGVIGLSRALLYAGAKSIIVSLWKVSDESTANLMIDFYANLIEKKEHKSKALHLAKKNMIEKGGNFAHPFFWSPFVLIGK